MKVFLFCYWLFAFIFLLVASVVSCMTRGWRASSLLIALTLCALIFLVRRLLL